MELLLVRHAEPHRVDGGEGVPADPGLTAAGVRRAGALAAHLGGERIDAVISSPLRRAIETAAPVAETHGLKVDVVDDLAEYDRHATTYIPLEELRGTDAPEWLAMREGRLHEVADGDPSAFRRRVVAGVESIVERHAGQRVVVVTHGGVVNAYVGHILGIARALWFEPRYAAITRVAAQRGPAGARTLVTLNETP